MLGSLFCKHSVHHHYINCMFSLSKIKALMISMYFPSLGFIITNSLVLIFYLFRIGDPWIHGCSRTCTHSPYLGMSRHFRMESYWPIHTRRYPYRSFVLRSQEDKCIGSRELMKSRLQGQSRETNHSNPCSARTMDRWTRECSSTWNPERESKRYVIQISYLQ